MKSTNCNREVPKFSFDGQQMLGKCVYVVDGDTIDVSVKIPITNQYNVLRLRILGINTPEVRGASKEDGLVSKKFVEDLILHKMVAIECGKFDNFGRVLANVFILNNLATILLENNLAIPFMV